MNKQSSGRAERIMTLSARTWFIAVFAGQLIFAFYILMLYWRSTFQGNLEKWNTVTTHFYVKNDITGNLIFGIHVVFAAIITLLGPLQLIPRVRKVYPRFHRVSGRIYIVTAFVMSIGGLYLIWMRDAVGGLFNDVVISINGAIILIAATNTIRNARRRNIAKHSQWAVHLFVGVSGVWLFRVFLMLWLAVFRKPVGFDPGTFTGPFLDALGLFVYVFPQAIVAFYFYAKRSGIPSIKVLFSAILMLLTLGIMIGTAAATVGMWLPRI